MARAKGRPTSRGCEMRSNRFLAPALAALGVILGVPALADDPSAMCAVVDGAIDVSVVDVAGGQLFLCVDAGPAAAGLPCVFRDGDFKLACVTLDPGPNFIVLPEGPE